MTRQFRDDQEEVELAAGDERVRAKGELSRKRTIRIDDATDDMATDGADAVRGRALTVQGLYSCVVSEDGVMHRCYLRRLLKSFQTDARGVLAVGDWVWFRPAPGGEGMILRVEPRQSSLCRWYRNKEQVVAANVDQVLIVGSIVEPLLKINFIDRYLISSQRAGLRPLICLNKVDRIDGALIQPIVGMYSQLGYRTIVSSAKTGQGIEDLAAELSSVQTVIVGQSGVGKSSLLNALEPSFHLKVAEVSQLNQKGRHTTTTARLLGWKGGGTVIDTPGVRQLELWSGAPAEVEAFYPDFRAYRPYCRFPGCTHSHEIDCAVRSAAQEGAINWGRYESYLKIIEADAPAAEEALA
jgi:ribosome biogenesis GTPase